MRQQVADLYREYREQQEKLASYDVDQEFRRREMDFLAYEIGEIEEAGIRDGEREELEEVCRKYGHAKQLTEMLGRILTELGDSENEGAEEAVSRASRDLHEAAGLDPALAGYCEPLETAADLLRTTHRELVDYLEDLSYESGGTASDGAASGSDPPPGSEVRNRNGSDRACSGGEKREVS